MPILRHWLLDIYFIINHFRMNFSNRPSQKFIKFKKVSSCNEK